MYKIYLRYFKTQKQRTREQIRELREDLNKQQSETKDSIKRVIHELKRNTQIVKEELITDLENLRRKNQIEILEIKSSYSQTKNTVEGQYSRLEHVKDRISELKDKIGIKEKQKKS
jgi:hypothetical protein